MLFIEKELHKIKKEPQKYGSGINSIFCIMPIHPATCRGGGILGDYVKNSRITQDIFHYDIGKEIVTVYTKENLQL